jgi:hypothetical protein
MEPNQTDSPSAGQGNGAQAGGGIIGQARERATAELTEQKNRAVDGIGSLTQAVRQSTQQLRDQDHDTLAQYVERAASQIDRLAQQLRDKDVNDLFMDVQRLARRQPAVFIGSAFALGLIGARFLKSSSRGNGSDEGSYEWRGSSTQPVRFSGTSPRTPEETARTSAGEFGPPTGSTDIAETGAMSATGTPSSAAGSSSGRSGSSGASAEASTPRTRRSPESGRR